MSVPFNAEQFADLKAFVDVCIKNPASLHKPELSFIKTLIEHFGGTVPKPEGGDSQSKKPDNASKSKANPQTKPEPESKETPESESEESDLELDMTDVIKPDTDLPQKMGNLTLQPTEEEQAESQAKRSQAVSACSEMNYDKAIELFTEAIVLNPQSSILYAKRGQVYLTLKKPNACIRDCDRALELNPDSAAAYKYRGRAYYLLGEWEKAAKDLRLACKYDFDEQLGSWLQDATPNARKIEEHKRKKQRKVQEKMEQERQEKAKNARESARAYEENTRPSQTESDAGERLTDFCQFINDLDVLEDFKDGLPGCFDIWALVRMKRERIAIQKDDPVWSDDSLDLKVLYGGRNPGRYECPCVCCCCYRCCKCDCDYCNHKRKYIVFDPDCKDQSVIRHFRHMRAIDQREELLIWKDPSLNLCRLYEEPNPAEEVCLCQCCCCVECCPCDCRHCIVRKGRWLGLDV